MSFKFPAPIGGTPFTFDFAPSVVFTVAWALLVPLVAWRIISPKSRTCVSANPMALVLERLIILSLRSSEAHMNTGHISHNLNIFIQTTYSLGFVNLTSGILGLLRNLLVSATLSSVSDNVTAGPIAKDDSESTIAPESTSTIEAGIAERAGERMWYRRITNSLIVAFLLPLSLGIAAGVVFPKAERNVHMVDTERSLRYITGAISYLLLLLVQGLTLYAAVAVRGIARTPVWTLFILLSLLNIVAIYRLVVMRSMTDSATSLAAGSLNTRTSKILFYVLHLVPEWLVAAFLLGVNAREFYRAGLWGDQIKPLEKGLVPAKTEAETSR
ncbi:hypothetical protein EUX98_g3243 [Antrodiella citrinella]|uniref:Uncharacterized protein n=1 Tax=Antrodiella citrinella TaxID=2447956 RepID=A0A4S4MZU2_9APHY|nr:hypothetical protein EUX98_g3243 [Antrodiella citrinella]